MYGIDTKQHQVWCLSADKQQQQTAGIALLIVKERYVYCVYALNFVRDY